eukprot:16433173-Heterocapsa_arctica.AAC.1
MTFLLDGLHHSQAACVYDQELEQQGVHMGRQDVRQVDVDGGGQRRVGWVAEEGGDEERDVRGLPDLDVVHDGLGAVLLLDLLDLPEDVVHLAHAVHDRRHRLELAPV